MKTFDLPRVPPPPPAPEPKVCVACRAFRAECVAPVGESSAPMCWACAHHVVEHDRKLEDAAEARCECLPHEIYPGRRFLGVVHGDVTREMIEKASPEDLLRGSSFSDFCAERTRAFVENMTPAQRKIYEGNAVPVSVCRPPHGSYTGSIKGLEATKMWVDDPAPRKRKPARCGICFQEGHYAPTCPYPFGR